ncbi:MAG: hypothetical protein AAF533_26740 [Acidobacteriota bacterium]
MSRDLPQRRGTAWAKVLTDARGLTYIELMMCVVIMAILGTVALPTAMHAHRRTQEAQLKRALSQIRNAIDAYHEDWKNGYIVADDDQPYPEDLEVLTQEWEYTGPGAKQPAAQSQPTGPRSAFDDSFDDDDDEIQIQTKIYLPRIPKDPFNEHDDEWDVSGWKARAYDDDWDTTTWGGDDVYQVYSSSFYLALDGLTRYEQW